jgi:hypothetical protein
MRVQPRHIRDQFNLRGVGEAHLGKCSLPICERVVGDLTQSKEPLGPVHGDPRSPLGGRCPL